MTQNNAYATDKLLAYPDELDAYCKTGVGKLISVHLMPQNLCNQRCAFCSYRLPGNKNSIDFNEGTHIELPNLIALLNDFAEMGVRGVEVTGGGEPMAYPYVRELWSELNRHGFATALVTNGTLMRDHAPLVTERMKWARVSIDSATKETYATMRRCPPNHFELAKRAVQELRKYAPKDPEFRLGCGFVLCNENVKEVYEFVKLARDLGADNVRLASTFSDQHLDYFKVDRSEVLKATEDSIRAKQDFETDSFKVHNLIPTRLWETEHPSQDYKRCSVKDFLCVVEGECKVYTCCTFTGSLKGLYGKFTEHPEGFKGLWKEYEEWRQTFDASKYCDVACLYRQRNLNIIDLINNPDTQTNTNLLHKEFI